MRSTRPISVPSNQYQPITSTHNDKEQHSRESNKRPLRAKCVVRRSRRARQDPRELNSAPLRSRQVEELRDGAQIRAVPHLQPARVPEHENHPEHAHGRSERRSNDAMSVSAPSRIILGRTKRRDRTSTSPAHAHQTRLRACPNRPKAPPPYRPLQDSA